MNCTIDGVIVRELTRHHDQRGWLAELFRHDELPPKYHPAMGYVSMTMPGESRGPHEHRLQTDLFCFLGPSTFRLYLWDNRSNSPTFGKKCVMDVGEDANTLVLVPAGVVHGYRNLGAVEGLVFNAPNRMYRGPGRAEPVDEIRHEADPNTPFKFED